MRETDIPYYSNGLMLDLKPRNPRKKKKPHIEVGDEVRGKVADYQFPVRGFVGKVLENSIILKIENTFSVDQKQAYLSNNIAVMRIKDVFEVLS